MSAPFFHIKKDEMQHRTKRLQQSLKEDHLDACLIENPVDLLYFTGVDLSCGKLWIHHSGSALFVDGRYIEAALKLSSVQPVILQESEAEIKYLESLKIKNLALDSTYTSVARMDEMKKLMQKVKEPIDLVFKQNLTAPIRLIKGITEIEQIKNSVKVLKKSYQHLLKKLKEGVTERDLAVEFEIFLRQNGAQSSSFEPIIAFGKNAAMPHYRAGRSRLKKNQLVLMDLGVCVGHYKSDMTRIVFHGVPDPTMLRIALTVRKAHKAAVALCKPGVRLGQLDEVAREPMKAQGLEQYYTHSLGHGIGLEIHEYPRVRFDGRDKDLILEPGMVITIEPGLYIPGKGGVRWEDMILITNTGHENLTKSI